MTKKKSAGIEELLGHALGCVGLSLDDFCRLTPSEFGAVCKAWLERQEQTMQDGWERMRMKAANTMAGKDAAGFGRLKDQVTELSKVRPLTRDELTRGLYQVISNVCRGQLDQLSGSLVPLCRRRYRQP